VLLNIGRIRADLRRIGSIPPSLPKRSATTILPARTPIDPVQGRRLSHDFVRCRGHVIAARAGDFAHRYDDRLASLAGEDHLAPDRFRGDNRAARAVDAKEDRTHRTIAYAARNARAISVAAITPPTGQRGCAETRHRVGSAPTRRSAQSLPPRYAVARRGRDRSSKTVSSAPDRARVGSGQDLVAVAEAIDELCLERFIIGEERPRSIASRTSASRQFSTLGDPTDDLPGYRASSASTSLRCGGVILFRLDC